MNKYLDYKDTFITVFNDPDKLMLVFLTDSGHTEAVSYDDNFFYVEYLIDIYEEMLEKSLKTYKLKNELDANDYREIKSYVNKYIKHLKKFGDLDLTCCNKQVCKILEVVK